MSRFNACSPYVTLDPADFTRPLLSEEVVLTPNNTGLDLCFSVEVVDDSVYEELEYLQVALSTEDECVLFKESSVTLDIVDNDCECMYIHMHNYIISEDCNDFVMLYCCFCQLAYEMKNGSIRISLWL